MYPRRPSSTFEAAFAIAWKELDRALDKQKVDLYGRDFPELLFDWGIANDKSTRKNLRTYLGHIPTETHGALVNSLEHIAVEAAVDGNYLRGVVSGTIPKSEPRVIRRRGKTRMVHAPTEEYRKVLDWLYRRVVSPLDRKNHNFCHAYRTSVKRNTLTCMRPHCNSDWFINVDVRHFFESVTWRQINEIFAEEYAESSLLAELVTIQEGGSKTLPQGFPTSGVLANLALRKFDSQLSNWIRAQRSEGLSLNYTRYSDDIVISGTFTQDDFDPSTQTWGLSAKKRKTYINVVRTMLESFGFEINPKKTRFVQSPDTFRALGLEISKRHLRPDRRTRNFLSMQCYGIAKNGLRRQADKWASRNCGCPVHLGTGGKACIKRSYAPMISGYLTYCASIDPEYVGKLRKQIAGNFPLIVGDALDTSLIRWKDPLDDRDVKRTPGRFHLDIEAEVEGFIDALPQKLWDFNEYENDVIDDHPDNLNLNRSSSK